MFRKMPFILLAVIAIIMLLDPVIPFFIKQYLYSVSLTIKAIIVFLLPIIIFSLLFKSAVTLSSGATKIIGIILILVCCSNFLSTFLSHYVGELIYKLELSMIMQDNINELVSLWSIDLPKLIANDKAMFFGILLGILASKLCPKKSALIATKVEKYVNYLLAGFIYFIPLFVAGFIIKLQYDKVIWIIIKDYTAIFALIALAQFCYIILSYFLINGLKIKNCLENIKHMIPAAISGFSTMSSAASMPLTIIGVSNSVKNKDLANATIPATVNIHLVGDCFAIPIFAYAILKSFGMPEPSIMNYLIFTLYFVLAKFSVAAIPGGGILVMLPILENYLGFNGEMMSLITALYILFDPVITCANVIGNGAFAKMIDNLFIFWNKKCLIKKNT